MTTPKQSPDKQKAVRLWQAREIYAKWARKEHKEMPDYFVDASALRQAEAEIEKLKDENFFLRNTIKIYETKYDI